MEETFMPFASSFSLSAFASLTVNSEMFLPSTPRSSMCVTPFALQAAIWPSMLSAASSEKAE